MGDSQQHQEKSTPKFRLWEKESTKKRCSIAENRNNVENRIELDFRMRTKKREKICQNVNDWQSLTLSIKITFTIRNEREERNTTNGKASGRMKRKDYVIWFVRWFISHTFTFCLFFTFMFFSLVISLFFCDLFSVLSLLYFLKCFHRTLSA